MSNFTLDDTDPSLTYSSNGWAIQPPTDPDLQEFFDQTYHAAQTDGATVSFTFQGTAFALYGSKGPGHVRALSSSAPWNRHPSGRSCAAQGKFQVQFDSTVVNLDASASQTAFRQQLFAHTFAPPRRKPSRQTHGGAQWGRAAGSVARPGLHHLLVCSEVGLALRNDHMRHVHSFPPAAMLLQIQARSRLCHHG